jgi:solute carrier family 24 (sodium/potassium/calcium exchanger), member 6
VNFYAVSWCIFGGTLQYLYYPISVLIIFFLFRFISSTVEEYIAPGITYISETLKLSDSLSAVTLLALANGAGDVITALVASGKGGATAVSYNIGSIYGSSLFVCSIVIAITILRSKSTIVVEKSTIYRDVGLYIVATLMMFLFAALKSLSLFSAITMLALYILLVAIVIV